MWPPTTSPPSRYTAEDDLGPPRFVLEQVDDTNFVVVEAFRYHAASRREPILVDGRELPLTDLASIPWFLTWFVGRHGRHTPAALVHDCLVRKARDARHTERRAEADAVFRDALDELGVPPVRSRTMWAAVTFGTRWHAGWAQRLGLGAWLVSAALGTGLLLHGVFGGTPVLAVLAVLAPLLGAALWGRQYTAGLVASYALLLVAGPTVACLVGYGLYWAVEQLVRVGRAFLPRAERPRLDDLPGPTPFGQVFAVAGRPLAADRTIDLGEDRRVIV